MHKITLEIEQLTDGQYLCTSPQLPGLVVQAASVREVLRLLPDVAHDLLAVMAETQQPLPPAAETAASEIEAWQGVYKGLSDDEIAEVEAIALDRRRAFL